jgi:hypothetical protein
MHETTPAAPERGDHTERHGCGDVGPILVWRNTDQPPPIGLPPLAPPRKRRRGRKRGSGRGRLGETRQMARHKSVAITKRDFRQHANQPPSWTAAILRMGDQNEA